MGLEEMLRVCETCQHPLEEHDGGVLLGEQACLVEDCNCTSFLFTARPKMEEMLKKAIEALEANPVNEVELTDGNVKVRVVKDSPVIWYYSPTPYQHQPYST